MPVDLGDSAGATFEGVHKLAATRLHPPTERGRQKPLRPLEVGRRQRPDRYAGKFQNPIP